MGFLKLRYKINSAIIVAYCAVALMLFLVLGSLQKRQEQQEIEQLKQVLSLIAQTENTDLSNEVFEESLAALKLRLSKIMKHPFMIGVAVSDTSKQILSLQGDIQPSISQSASSFPFSKVIRSPSGRNLYFVQKLTFLGENLGFIHLNFSLEELDQKISQNRTFFIGVLILTLIIMLSVLNTLFFFSVLLPVQSLRNAMRRMQQGNWGEQIQVKNRDELGQLAHTFNKMSVELKDLTTGLEHKIQKRTQNLNAAFKEAEQANQAKSHFLAKMSHELRTPLNGILGYAQILKRDSTLNPKQLEGVEIIRGSGEHLLGMINEILDLSKIEANKINSNPTEVHLPSFIRMIVRMIEIRTQEKGLSFEVNIPEALPESVCFDEMHLRQVLLNLLANSVKFTHQGSISFQIIYVRKSDNAPSKLLFHIHDTGVGIAPEEQTQVFKAFEQVGEQSLQEQGTGLGLAISQKLIQIMGGCLSLKSELGEGSTFSVEIPVTQVLWGETKKRREQERITGYRSTTDNPERIFKVLIVDDHLENRMLLQDLLLPLGFETELSSGGIAVLAVICEFKPDLILVDLFMPEINGFEIAEKVRQNPKAESLKIIAISATISPQIQQRSLNSGCDDFIPKPVRLELLLECIEKHLSLQWITQKDSFEATQETSEAIEAKLPSSSELDPLLQATLEGDVLELETQLKLLQLKSPNYAPFLNQLEELRSDFKMMDLEQMIREAMGEMQ